MQVVFTYIFLYVNDSDLYKSDENNLVVTMEIIEMIYTIV